MDKVEPKFYVVCQHCLVHNKDNPTLEFNFKEQAVFYMCPSCKKQSKMTIKAATAQPLPRAGLAR